jgi:hypothetical protein
MSDDPPAPPSYSDSLNGHTDPIIQHAAYGLRVWAQLKQIEPHERAFHAVAALQEEDLRAVVTHHLFAWHQKAGMAERRRADPA